MKRMFMILLAMLFASTAVALTGCPADDDDDDSGHDHSMDDDDSGHSM